jgi:hypothetical protein
MVLCMTTSWVLAEGSVSIALVAPPIPVRFWMGSEDLTSTDTSRSTSPHRKLRRARFVHLRRRHVVAQAVSWAKELQSHLWHAGEAIEPEVKILTMTKNCLVSTSPVELGPISGTLGQGPRCPVRSQRSQFRGATPALSSERADSQLLFQRPRDRLQGNDIWPVGGHEKVPVGGHEKVPVGGRETARWWPRNCPLVAMNCRLVATRSAHVFLLVPAWLSPPPRGGAGLSIAGASHLSDRCWSLHISTLE